MNAKLSKQFRRLAEKMTVGLPKVAYEDYSPPEFKYYQIGNGLEQMIKIKKGVSRVLAKSTRKAYKILKKGGDLNELSK